MAAALAGAWVPLAQAGHPDSERELTRAEAKRAIGASVRATAAGYEVTLRDGVALPTHGPDPGKAVGVGTGFDFAAGAPEREPVCAESGGGTELLYAHPPERGPSLALIAELRSGVARMNEIVSRSSVLSGGPVADLRLRCDGAGAPRVESFPSSADDFQAVVDAARQAGHDATDTDYLILYGGPDGSGFGTCGVATRYEDDRLSANNANNNPPQVPTGYAVVWNSWGSSSPDDPFTFDCWRYNIALLHELAHVQGAVAVSAPHATGFGHCWDEGESDVMCYEDGGDIPPGGMLDLCSGPHVFDCNFDDYFDAVTEEGEYLASSWNLGSRLNRFIAFDEAADATPPETILTAAPEDDGFVQGRSASISFRSDDPGASFRCSLDWRSYGPCSGPGPSHSIADLEDGTHELRAMAVDSARNPDPSPARVRFHVNRTSEFEPAECGLVEIVLGSAQFRLKRAKKAVKRAKREQSKAKRKLRKAKRGKGSERKAKRKLKRARKQLRRKRRAVAAARAEVAQLRLDLSRSCAYQEIGPQPSPALSGAAARSARSPRPVSP